MQYFITFLEGLMSFVSPCMLPLLPVYVSYFAGGAGERRKVFSRACFFVMGFTLVFCLLGVFAGTLGMLLAKYRRLVEVIAGGIVTVFGLSYLGVIKLPFFQREVEGKTVRSAAAAFLFGLVYSVSLTPCVGAFLGSALMLASRSEMVWMGLLLLLVYSLGLGIPFILSAVLIEQLKSAFTWIKRHYRQINLVCGFFLIVVGLIMAFGWLDRLMRVMV